MNLMAMAEDHDLHFHDAEMPEGDGGGAVANGSNGAANGTSNGVTDVSFDSVDSPPGEPVDGELSDVPIDTADHGASLPSAEELRHSLGPTGGTRCGSCGGGGRSRPLLWALAAALAVIVVVSIGAGVSRNKSGSAARTPAPRQSTVPQVVKYLAATGVSSQSDLQRGGSPQSLAVNWLANLDGKNLAVPTDGDGSTDAGYKYVTRYVLALLWYALDGTNWLNQFGFLTQNDLCYWNSPIPVTSTSGVEFVPGGVYCERESLNVAAIHLDFNELKGTIPSELTRLSSLQLLALDGNTMRGGMGTGLCQLTELKSLSLTYNILAGSIPSCISKLSQLEILMLSNNEFSGAPPDMSKLTNLRTLLLDDNKLEGTVTTAFNQLINLQYLFLQGNKFYGKLDDNFLNKASKLRRLDMSGCKFTGQVPSHFFALPELELIDLHSNSLSGSLPKTIPKNSALQYIALQENSLTGELHPSLTNLTRLFHFDVSNNTMTGQITARLGLMQLNYLFLANNQFVEGPIPTMFGLLTNLVELSLKGTNRNGTIPKWIGKNMTKLQLLDLDNNHLSGSIPTELGLLSNLEFLLLNRNSGIKGTMPTQLNQLSSLRSVFLDGTSLSGSLAPICKLPTLNTPDNGVKTTREFVIADCGGNNPKVDCSCCDLCCSNANPHCNHNTQVASLNPNWETSFQRVEYSFGTNETNFENRIGTVPNP